MNAVLKSLLHCLFPLSCLLCHRSVNRPIPLCLDCQDDLPWTKRANPFIHTLLPYSIAQEGIVVFDYKPPISNWLTALKFKKNLQFAPLLGALVAHRLAQESSLPETLIPIPLHWWRLYRRGFNQSIEIARWPSKALGIPISTHCLKRKKATKPQTVLSKQERARNPAGAFYFKAHSQPQHIALFDDVVTTGSTLFAACEAIKETNSNIEKISIWCCARAIPKEDYSAGTL